MRIALVSDIHGNLAALEAVAADIRQRGADRVVNLGDNLSGPLLPRETAQWLMASDWLSLAGNHERQVLNLRPGKGGPSDQYAHAQLTETEFAWMRSLAHCMHLDDNVLLCHGSPRSDHEYLLETLDGHALRLATPAEIGERVGAHGAVPVIACGHTHVPRAVRRGVQLLVNPGSVGLQAYSDDHPVDHAVQGGSPDARYALITLRNGHWQAEHIAVPYGHEAMALLAEQRGRPEWAHALRTGYMP
ncbi:metallophosphoesterase [Acidovorax sp. sic0104]|uniref:metallophosphoesterase family protein n=1 Tax=Acidovorax sp. sic0104 TaxID=2854784 RepID=UPI001C455DCC|nr:metallophosphoesterase family protein [Acidovorax sp. sic0104]MBV7542512.1 metallophosphatase family protein [Acidovorax sp. sic0104]